MPGRKPNDKNRVEIDYIVSWALYHSKVPVKKIAEERDQTTASIYWQIKQVDKALEEKIDIQKLKDLALLCYPVALESLIYNLRIKKDASVTNNYLNKTIFADVKESESTNTTNIFNLGAGLGSEVRGVETGKLQAIVEVLRDGDRKTGAPPVVSRVEGSPDN